MFWIIGIVVIVAVIATIVWRAGEVTLLTHHGVAGEGTVIKKDRLTGGKSRSSPILRYEYFGPNGERYENRISPSESFWKAHEVGDPIEIVYAKSKPSVSAAKEMINQCRETLNLPPL